MPTPMTKDELRDYVRIRARLDNDEYPDSDIEAHLDQALNDLTILADWPWQPTGTETINCDSSTEKYELSVTPAAHILKIENDTDRGLAVRYLSPQEFYRRRGDDFTAGGGPKKIWTVEYGIFDAEFHQYILLRPLSEDDVVVTFQYGGDWVNAPVGLEPPFHDQFHRILAYGALAEIWEEEEDFDKADRYLNRFRSMAGDMLRFYNALAQDRPQIYGEYTDQRRYYGPRANMPFLDGA